jgi:hypothetical protein
MAGLPAVKRKLVAALGPIFSITESYLKQALHTTVNHVSVARAPAVRSITHLRCKILKHFALCDRFLISIVHVLSGCRHP